MTEPILLRNDKSAVASLVLNSPRNLNALSDEMIARLHEELDAIAGDRSVRAVILSGAGKAFCAGHDLKQMQQGRQAEDQGRAYFLDLFDRCSALMARIQSLPQPVIARVHGLATAAGCQLVATCDLAIADKDTKFGVNGVNIGLFCSTPMVALSRNIPTKNAFEMLTTGKFISAKQAGRLGLINRAVKPEKLELETDLLAEKIASKLASAVKIGKAAFYHQMHLPTREAYEFTADVMVENMLNSDTHEGIEAFLAKRKPDWAQ